jgi:hypothetical protein
MKSTIETCEKHIAELAACAVQVVSMAAALHRHNKAPHVIYTQKDCSNKQCRPTLSLLCIVPIQRYEGLLGAPGQ